MLLKELISKVEVIKTVGDLNLDITNIHSDSRKIKKDGLFVAIDGFTENGQKYVPSAIENGAIAIIVEPTCDLKSMNYEGVTIVQVKDTRKALAQISCEFYDNPSKKLKLIGVTGTKGKTTSTFMIKSILQSHGYKVGLIGSIAVFIGDEQIEETDRTTPEAFDIQRNLARMVEENVDAAIIEVSSQAMKLHRVYGCDFDVALFTNLSEDHISPKEHPDMEDYFNCKLELLKSAKSCVINNDDSKLATIPNLLPQKTIKSFAINNDADFKIDRNSIIITDSLIDFSILYNGKEEKIEACIPGEYSIYNAAGSIAVSSFFGVTADEIRNALKDLKVLGRSELVPNKLGITIMIDYAHTPSSLESILTAVKSYAKGKVICAWGVGRRS